MFVIVDQVELAEPFVTSQWEVLPVYVMVPQPFQPYFFFRISDLLVKEGVFHSGTVEDSDVMDVILLSSFTPWRP